MIKQTDADKLIEAISKEFEKMEEIKPPEWAKFVKTGVHNERPPSQKNWWYIRSASILRKLSLGKPIGVSRIKRVYGGRKRRGHKPEHKYPASGSIIREIFKQLEKSGFVKTEKSKGRMITAKGTLFLKEIVKSVEK